MRHRPVVCHLPSRRAIKHFPPRFPTCPWVFGSKVPYINVTPHDPHQLRDAAVCHHLDHHSHAHCFSFPYPSPVCAHMTRCSAALKWTKRPAANDPPLFVLQWKGGTINNPFNILCMFLNFETLNVHSTDYNIRQVIIVVVFVEPLRTENNDCLRK